MREGLLSANIPTESRSFRLIHTSNYSSDFEYFFFLFFFMAFIVSRARKKEKEEKKKKKDCEVFWARENE